MADQTSAVGRLESLGDARVHMEIQLTGAKAQPGMGVQLSLTRWDSDFTPGLEGTLKPEVGEKPGLLGREPPRGPAMPGCPRDGPCRLGCVTSSLWASGSSSAGDPETKRPLMSLPVSPPVDPCGSQCMPIHVEAARAPAPRNVPSALAPELLRVGNSPMMSSGTPRPQGWQACVTPKPGLIAVHSLVSVPTTRCVQSPDPTLRERSSLSMEVKGEVRAATGRTGKPGTGSTG